MCVLLGFLRSLDVNEFGNVYSAGHQILKDGYREPSCFVSRAVVVVVAFVLASSRYSTPDEPTKLDTRCRD